MRTKAAKAPRTVNKKRAESAASRRARKIELMGQLAATVLVTAERKAAVTLSTAYNWKEWTYA